jgi:hypothetical protein
MRQVETSRTIVFDAPRRARAFVEALVVDNLDLGRPDNVELIFTGKRPGGRGRPIKLDTLAKTKVVTRDTEVTINAFFCQAFPGQAVPQGPGGRCASRRSSTPSALTESPHPWRFDAHVIRFWRRSCGAS